MNNKECIKKYLENIGLIKVDFKSKHYDKYKFPINVEIYHFVPDKGFFRIGKNLETSIAVSKKCNDACIAIGKQLLEKENGRKMC